MIEKLAEKIHSKIIFKVLPAPSFVIRVAHISVSLDMSLQFTHLCKHSLRELASWNHSMHRTHSRSPSTMQGSSMYQFQHLWCDSTGRMNPSLLTPVGTKVIWGRGGGVTSGAS